MPASERKRELRRRRTRTKKVTLLKARAAKATKSEKEVIANKLRRMTPGSELLIGALKLEG